MEFWSTILLSATISAIAAIGLFLQIRNGQMNVGMAVFVGIGGYVSGILSTKGGLSPAMSIPAGVLAGFLAGALYAALTLRLHHWFFAVTTLSLTIAAVAAVSQISYLGGALGLTNIPFVTSAPAIIIAAAAAFAVAWSVDHSNLGLRIHAMGDDQELAEVFGVRVKRLRIAIFGLGSGMAALSGALNAHRFGTAQPGDLNFQASLLLFVYVIVGGKNTVWGPVLGTFFLFCAPEIVKITPETELLVFGAMMLIVATWMPGGLAGGLQALSGCLTRVIRGPGLSIEHEHGHDVRSAPRNPSNRQEGP
jgi:branched-chain amino acid transport system permease protein